MFKKARREMANKAGQKREAAQANIESDEGARRTRSKLAGEDVKDINGNKRATRSSSGYDSTPREVFEGNGYGASPAKKESTKGADSRRAASTPRKKINKKGTAQKVVTPKKSAKPTIITNGSKASPKTKSNSKSAQRRSSSSLSDVVCGVSISVRKKEVAENEASDDNGSDGPSYWLMKAEPESRIEKDKDVKFSIDDLKDASEPEAWDGVRNPLARNNMRAMMTGDMAFFYHSNCKKPGIAGTMEIVREHSADETAFDPEHPYYDPKATREKSKWCVVHVEFRRKFPAAVTLKELQRYAKTGGVLENMQTLKTSRLSVSKVTKKEWDFINSLVDADDDTATAA